jgi:phosphoribosylformylglycinamidine (FGAM) synthase-like enzyme
MAECGFSRQIALGTHRFLGATVDLSTLPPQGGAKSPDEPSEPAASGGNPARQEPSPSLAVRLDALLFGETQNRVVISVSAVDAGRVVKQAQLMGVPAVRIGTVGGEALVVKTPQGEFSAPVSELHDAWWNSIARAMA